MSTLLLVDDEPQVLEGLRRALHDEPHVIVTATSAEQALSIMRERCAEVVISDDRMPGTSGTELLAQVAQLHPTTARIVLTGHANLDVTLRAINECGVYRFLRKPCSADHLVETVRAAFAYQRTVQTPRVRLSIDPTLSALTARERDVLQRLIAGSRVSEIARACFVSRHTVRNHIKALFSKLDVHSQTELRARFRAGPIL